jgi:hypothetical protein
MILQLQSEPDRSRRLIRFGGPGVIAIVTLSMLYWSWGTWPDPLVDFGTHLYVPWQLSLGKVLYRDVAYYNGPFSPYFNSLMFRIVGVSIRTLVGVNLLILTATMILAYRLTMRAGGREIAAIGGLTFVLFFGFGQIVLIGNYNWLTPYAHELTHGTALGLLAIACVNAHQRKGTLLWISAAGAAAGCAFLTKAEPAAAALPAIFIQLLAGWWGQRAGRTMIATSTAVIVGSFLAMPVLAWILLSQAMSPTRALAGVLGSWPWVFDRRVTSLAFYQNITGLNDVSGNLATLVRWTLAYAVLLGAGVILGFAARRAARIVSASAFAVVLAGLLWRLHQINWTGMLTPLPICLLIAFCLAAAGVVRRQGEANYLALRAALIVFSILLSAKMGLKPHVYHYGFVLAWPGTIVLVALVASDLPSWIARRGGSGAVVRAIGLAAWSAAVLAILNRDADNFDAKQFTVCQGTPDSFRASSCGLEVQLACDQIGRLIPENGTVAVFPQGLMINYLVRRVNPIPNVNFMPPEVLAVGEDAFIDALQQHPPDLVVVTSSVIQNDFFTLDGRDVYGAKMLRWIKKNYQPVSVVTLPQPLPTIYRFVISRRRTPGSDTQKFNQ